MSVINTIIFNNSIKENPCLCYKTGLLGCKSIKSINHGKDNGIEIYSYEVKFESGKTIEIKDTILAIS